MHNQQVEQQKIFNNWLHVIVDGKAMTECPEDLYIPPQALEVILEQFSGPLDLLLYLIKRDNLDIVNIPIAEITNQYVEYIELMQVLKLELAADYLVMAATLAQIKSRMLLPRPKHEEDEDYDPRADLIRRLQEYEQFKEAATSLDEIPRNNRDFHETHIDTSNLSVNRPLPQVSFAELLLAFKDVYNRVDMSESHKIDTEVLSVRERMTQVLAMLNKSEFTDFTHLFPATEGRQGLITTFLALLELAKNSMIELVQNTNFSPIHVRTLA